MLLNKKSILDCGYCISTVSVRFMAWYGPYETAINVNGNTRDGWRILKGYDTYDEAIEGHYKFTGMTKEILDSLERIG